MRGRIRPPHRGPASRRRRRPRSQPPGAPTVSTRQTFRGGVHPPESKGLTEHEGIRSMPAPRSVVVPLRQHLGVPAKALVKAGDRVAEGQPIGEPAGFVSAPVHAPIAGEVTFVGLRTHPGGYACESVVIEARNGESPETWRLPGARADWESLERGDLIRLIREAGIVGLGGAAFPTHVKLTPPEGKPIDLLVINGAECEPFLTCDHRVMLEETAAVATGVRILKRALDVPRAIVGIEENKPDAIAALTAAFAGDEGIEVAGCRVKYPQGAEKQLINALTGREVPPPPGLPLDVGVVVQNVGTAAAIARAVTEGIPLIERVATVSGSAICRPSNVRLRIGTRLREVVDFCGGLSRPPAKVVLGGPMMGAAVADLDVPVVKATSGLLFFTRDECPEPVPYPCIRCGRCGDACPLGLQPSEIARRVEITDLDTAEALHIQECMECGSCAFICPSNRWLVQQLRLGKAKLHDRKQKRSA